MKRVVINSPNEPGPFFNVGSALFVNVVWNWGEPLQVEVADLVRLLASAPPGSIIIGRRLEKAERRQVERELADGQADTFARVVIPSDAARWQVPKGRR